MIAVSSFRPHSQSEVYRANQIAARRSWEDHFERIFYFGSHEPELDGEKTLFVRQTEQWPRIREMASFCASQDPEKLVAIVNADIVVTGKILDVEKAMIASKLLAATTRRRDLKTRELIPDDKGRDIFILTPATWRKAASRIPPECRIGHQQWDSWMIGFLRKECEKKFAQFNDVPCVFHPAHGERLMPHAADVERIDPTWLNFHRNDTLIRV